MKAASPSILVTGSEGQLGNELKTISSNYPQYNFLFTGKQELPIENQEAVRKYFSEKNITHCINAAAYTLVDLAEDERDRAKLINGDAVSNLAESCRNAGASFIHVSTDYVFDGKADTPYKEDYETSPVNYYGNTKLLGEHAALEKYPPSIVIRTSWLYSSFGKNFVKTMMRLMSERSEISVVNDQVGSPTYAADLAEAIMKIVSSGKALTSGGVYHFSNKGIISWHQFAEAIRDLSNLSCKVIAIPSSAYPTKAARPKYSALDTQKITETFSIEPKPWRESLSRCINLLANI